MVGKKSRRSWLKATGVAGVGLLAGCSSGGGDSEDGGSGGNESGDDTTTASDSGTSEGPTANIGLVLGVGGLGDQGFNDLAHEGVQRAEEELGISFDMAQPDDETQLRQYQSRFAGSTDPEYDLVCCIGYTQASALSEVAPNNPDQDFMIVDATVDEPNVAGYTFEEHKGAFLIGTIGAHLTTQSFAAGGGETTADTKTLGFVGGTDSFLINKFRAGYEAGAQDVDSEIEVLASYVGSFSDPSTAKESAKGMYSNGADIVYPAAGGSGVGVFQAAQEDTRFSFGSDTPKSITQPSYANVILGSMIKKTDSAVYEGIEAIVNDAFDGSTNVALGLESEGVGVAWGDQLGSEIPQEVKDAVETKRQAIIDGDIEVPSEL